MKNILGNKLIVGNGLKPLLYIVQLSFSKLYKNGTIIHCLPRWVSYSEQTNLIGSNVVTVPCNKNWKIEPHTLDNILSKISGPKMILFNNPNNPSGCVYNEKEIIEICKIFKKYDVIVLSDDIYLGIVHDNKKCSSIKDYYKNVIYGSSLSKLFACGGYRLGWFVFPKNNLDNLYNACISIASSIYSCPSVLLQYAAADALLYPDDIKDQLKFLNKIFNDIAQLCRIRFDKMKIIYSDSQAAWYFLLDFINYKDELLSKNINNSDELCSTLINDIGLITVSGDAFSIDKPYILRYSYVDIKNIDIDKYQYDYSNILEGLEELHKWITNL